MFNTLFNLLTQDDQVRCFENVAKHLTDDGLFVVEAFVPSYLTRLRDDQYVDAEQVGVDHVTFDVGRHDPVTQQLDESHVVLSPEGLRFFPIVTRWAWPSELDLMAGSLGYGLRIAGAAGNDSPSPRRAATTSLSTDTDRPGIAHPEELVSTR